MHGKRFTYYCTNKPQIAKTDLFCENLLLVNNVEQRGLAFVWTILILVEDITEETTHARTNKQNLSAYIEL